MCNIELRWAVGRFEHLAQVDADLVALHVDVIVTSRWRTVDVSVAGKIKAPM